VFKNDQEAHAHALETLNVLTQYYSFLESIDTLVDMGCGSGLDLEWWAGRYIEDDDGNHIPLNITCTGIDLNPALPVAKQYKNMSYERRDFETIEPTKGKKGYDVIWCHNSFQYVLNPLETLKRWRNIMTDGGMLCIVVPTTTEIEFNKLNFTQQDYAYHNYTTVSMLHMLALTGFDCAFMKKLPSDPWLHAIAYKSDIEPMDPRTTRWYHLAETGLLPESAVKSINERGFLAQQDLVLEWVDTSLRWYGED
jgi:SAM-dependent methyltransferase